MRQLPGRRLRNRSAVTSVAILSCLPALTGSSTAATAAAAPVAVAASTVVPPTYAHDVGFRGTGEISPVDQVRDAAGNWYVMDEAQQCIKVYSPTATLLRSIFTCWAGGNDATHIRRARGLGFDAGAQAIWVADTTNARVLKVSTAGTLLASATAASSPGGRLDRPADVAVDDVGNAYVIDQRNRVVKLSPSGAYLQQWGASGSGVGQMQAPLSIAYSAVGSPTLYVTDAANGRIVRWGPDGSWRGTLGSVGTGLGQFTRQPRGIAVDAAGTVYASDVGGNRINRYDALGRPLPPLGTGLPYHRSELQDLFYGARGLWVAGSTLAVADMWNFRTLLWTLSGEPRGQLGGPRPPAAGHVEPHGVALDSEGNVYVSDYWHQHIQKFDAAGVLRARWGIGRGTQPGTLNLPGGIDIDDTRDFLYIANREERVIDRWRLSDGRFDKRYALPPVAGVAGWPRDVAVDEQRQIVYAPDEKGRQVVAFDATTGAVRRIIRASGPLGSAGALHLPYSVALDEQQNLYVADAGRQRISVYAPDGRWLRDLVAPATPRGIDVRAGVVYVLSGAAYAVSAQTGALLYRFAASGVDANGLHSPYVGIHAAADGSIYIADSDAGRVKVFR